MAEKEEGYKIDHRTNQTGEKSTRVNATLE